MTGAGPGNFSDGLSADASMQTKLRSPKTSLSANETTIFFRAAESCGPGVWYIACFCICHENETFNSTRVGVAFLTGHASARERKSLLDSANMCWAESLTLFSTGFGFWGLARTSPQFFLVPAGLLMKPRDRRYSWEQACGAAQRVSLSPAEGERAGVRGKRRTAIDQRHVPHPHATPHPDPLAFRRGEEGRRRIVM